MTLFPHHRSHYATVSEAINALRNEGYTVDFNLSENCLLCGEDRYHAEELFIADVYRYEGNTDPADEATVYAIESGNGVKGILVTGYGASGDVQSETFLAGLKMRK